MTGKPEDSYGTRQAYVDEEPENMHRLKRYVLLR